MTDSPGGVRPPIDWRARSHWIFDMDGTLTVAVHDFDAIRSALGLPPGEPILEALSQMPSSEARAALARLDEIEREIALQARAGDGAEALLSSLADRGITLGILTRNAVEVAHQTLRTCGLGRYFDPRYVLGRESGEPKPKPDGVHKLLDLWRVGPEQAVMVGDYYFDLVAGRSAGTATVYLDPSGGFEWAEYADVSIERLEAVLALLE